jgi:hypothetical protein
VTAAVRRAPEPAFAAAQAFQAAAIRVTIILGAVALVVLQAAGGDDVRWPSLALAAAILGAAISGLAQPDA